MTRQRLLHEILADIISAMVFKIKFKAVTNNNDGTYTLNGICDFHHAQPGYPITINSHAYTIVDYSYDQKTLTVKGIDAIGVTEFDLYTPFFFHGTPYAQQAEFSKIQLDDKVPMVYLMEPYESEYDETNNSSIAYRAKVMLCFLTNADILKLGTDDLYHTGVNPMNNLMNDVFEAIKESNLFNNTKQKFSPKYFTKFGIVLTDKGTKKPLFSEMLSGCSQEIKLEVYETTACVCADVLGFDDGYSIGFK